jgi:hypothetical protein
MAQAAKAKAPASDSIMSPGEMKPLLALSKREPVHAAIGITADGEGIILLNKKMKSKKVLATLKAAAAKEKIQLQPSTLRFGKAEVDTDYDPGMVRFFINKEAPGNMRIKLLEVVKRVPYQKVELNVDLSFEEESEDEEEGQETASAPPPPPPQAATRPDAGALAKELAALARRIPEVPDTDPALKARLVKLATDANVNIKTNNLNYATNFIAQLRDALRDALDAAGVGIGQVVPPSGQAVPPSGQPTAEGGSVVAYAKSRLAWLAARKKVESDIETLRQRIIDTFKDDAIAPQLETSYKTKVAPVLATLDESLADTLDDATNATDPAKRAKLVADAKAIMQKYAQYLTSEPLIKDLDENPFVPLSIRATVGGTISALSKAIH